MPLVAAVSLLTSLSLMGVPKLNGFIGMRLIVESAWSDNRVWSVVATAGMALSGVALLWLFSRTMLGELRTPAAGAPKDLRVTEALVFVPLVALVIWVGVRPAPLLSWVETSVARVVLQGQPAVRPSGGRLPDTAGAAARRYGPASWHGPRGAVRRRNR